MTQPTEQEPLLRWQAVEAHNSKFGSPIPPLNPSGWILTCGMIALLACATWVMSSLKFPRTQSVEGQLAPTKGALRISAARQGVIERVSIRQGQVVYKGQELFEVRTDSIMSGGASTGRALALAADTENGALVAQRTAQQASYHQQAVQLEARSAGLKRLRSRLAGDRALQIERLNLAQVTLDSMRPILEKGFISRARFRDQESAVLEARQGLSAIERQIEETDSSLQQLVPEVRRVELDASNYSAQNAQQVAQIAEKKAEFSADSRVSIVAPTSGQIIALQAHVGEQISPSKNLIYLLPKGSILQAELWLPSRAAGFIHEGNEVRLMYDAFPFQQFGLQRGKVIAISHAPTLPADLPTPGDAKEPLYRVDVALPSQRIDAYGRDWALVPGMRLNAEIILSSRSILGWILDPLLALRHRQ